ncbi:MAG TPA: hypothetical protein VGH14_10975, partial [Solirubrobacterales bacterium]
MEARASLFTRPAGRMMVAMFLAIGVVLAGLSGVGAGSAKAGIFSKNVALRVVNKGVPRPLPVQMRFGTGSSASAYPLSGETATFFLDSDASGEIELNEPQHRPDILKFRVTNPDFGEPYFTLERPGSGPESVDIV